VDSPLDTSPASVLLGSLIAGWLAELMGIMGDDGRHWVPVRLHDRSIMSLVDRLLCTQYWVARSKGDGLTEAVRESQQRHPAFLTAFNSGVFR
jgi:hypothetical protein